MQKRLIVMMIVATFLAGCLPSQNQSPVDVQPQINTAVAQTMEAQQQVEDMVAQTVAAQIPAASPTLEFTSTSTVLPTTAFATVIISTDTPLPVTLPPVNPPDTSTPLPVQPTYACDVYTSKPDYREEIKAGAKFDIKWLIVNTGTRAWPAGTDVKYSNGWEMTSVKSVEITSAVNPQDRYTITLDAVAPSQKGLQYMTWAVEGQLCYPSVIINVK